MFEGRPSRRLAPRFLGGSLCLATMACGARSPQVMPEACAPVEEVSGLSRLQVDRLAGEYELTLEATTGTAAGRSTSGRLWLYPNEPEMRGIRAAGGGVRSDASAPLYGASDIDVEDVGGLRLGDAMSRDPQSPGVLLLQQGEQLFIRVGAEANRRDLLRFDGGYFALRVREVDENGFAGSWSSGLMSASAEGHFCAVRLAP